jgi:hypothetical protein
LGFLGLRTVVRGFPAGVEGSRAVPSHAPRAHGAGSPLQPRKELSCVSVGCVGVATSRALVLQSHRGKLVQVRSTLTSSYALTPPLWASRCVLLELYVIKRTVLVWPLRTPSLIITPTALYRSLDLSRSPPRHDGRRFHCLLNTVHGRGVS